MKKPEGTPEIVVSCELVDTKDREKNRTAFLRALERMAEETGFDCKIEIGNEANTSE